MFFKEQGFSFQATQLSPEIPICQALVVVTFHIFPPGPDAGLPVVKGVPYRVLAVALDVGWPQGTMGWIYRG